MNRHFKIGDALVILFLLLFIFGWIGGAIWAYSLPSEGEQEIEGFAATVILIIIAAPPLWAGRLVSRIVEGDING